MLSLVPGLHPTIPAPSHYSSCQKQDCTSFVSILPFILYKATVQLLQSTRLYCCNLWRFPPPEIHGTSLYETVFKGIPLKSEFPDPLKSIAYTKIHRYPLKELQGQQWLESSEKKRNNICKALFRVKQDGYEIDSTASNAQQGWGKRASSCY